MSRTRKWLYWFLGGLFLVFAYIGILLPGVPAIPFILLSGWFFINSSDKLYNWLLRQPIIGKILTKYFSKDGVSSGAIWFIISQWWVSLLIAQLLLPFSWAKIVLLNSIGFLGSLLIYKIIPKKKQ